MTKQALNPTLGRYIKQRRLARGIDVRTCAKQAGIDLTYWWKVEAGSVRSPAPRFLKAMAEVLEVPPVDLYALSGYETHDELPALAPYLRSRYGELPPEAIRDLEQYFAMLRSYYDIPADQPVFPSQKSTQAPPQRAKPARDAKNRPDHPWRGAV